MFTTIKWCGNTGLIYRFGIQYRNLSVGDRYHPLPFKHVTENKLHSLLKIQCSSIQPCRTLAVFSSKTSKRFKPMHEQDGIGKNYEMVMDNSMKNYIRYCPPLIYGFMGPTGLLSIFQVAKWYQTMEELTPNHPAMLSICFSVFSVVLISLTSAMIRRVFLRIYHQPNSDKFIGITQQWNLSTSKVNFTTKDCTRLERNDVLGILSGNVKIKKRPFLILVNDFKLAQYYNQILGYHLDRKDDDDDPFVVEWPQKYRKKN